jgi:hypothetical protein
MITVGGLELRNGWFDADVRRDGVALRCRLQPLPRAPGREVSSAHFPDSAFSKKREYFTQYPLRNAYFVIALKQ